MSLLLYLHQRNNTNHLSNLKQTWLWQYIYRYGERPPDWCYSSFQKYNTVLSVLSKFGHQRCLGCICCNLCKWFQPIPLISLCVCSLTAALFNSFSQVSEGWRRTSPRAFGTSALHTGMPVTALYEGGSSSGQCVKWVRGKLCHEGKGLADQERCLVTHVISQSVCCLRGCRQHWKVWDMDHKLATALRLPLLLSLKPPHAGLHRKASCTWVCACREVFIFCQK